MQHLEKAVTSMPGAEGKIAHVREMAKRIAQSRAAASNEQAEADAANA
jgi:hypothetical protein